MPIAPKTIIRLSQKIAFSAAALLAAHAMIHAVEAQTNVTRLPEMVVTADTGDSGTDTLRQQEVVGPNQQPEWTTQRRFANTRIYVAPPWQVEFEQWWKAQYLRGDKTAHLFQSEVSVGLPYRLQLDLYENVERTEAGSLRHQGNQVEVRYALADWGKIPLNPTLYGEWAFNEHDPDKYEVKLLLGANISPRWQWGFNAAYEQAVGGARESELALSQGFSYTLIDQKLSAGVEMQMERRSSPNFSGFPEVEFNIGPSIQWRPIPRMHVDVVPLAGTTHDSPLFEGFLIVGINFGKEASADHYSPASLRSR
jgi:hypothetical protein